MTLSSDSPPDHDTRPRAGTSAYRRTVVALVAAAVATFAQLWSLQPILPAISQGFDASASQAALSISLATGGLAGFTLVWSGVADRLGRARVIAVSLLAATALGCLTPFAGELWLLLGLRALQGAALGGVPAAAVAYLAEEVHPSDAPRATGLYIAGNPLGGMGGRLLAGFATDLGGWQWGIAANTLLGLAALAVFALVLPCGPHRRGATAGPGPATAHGAPATGNGTFTGPAAPGMGARLRAALATRGLPALYAQALLLMGAFMTVYNLLGFRLTAPPFGLSQAAASLLFLSYTAGMLGSAVAGNAVARWGGYAVLTTSTVLMAAGLGGLFGTALPGLLAALLVMTFAFFSAHATASAWVGARAVAGRAQAMAVYTLAYYLGSSLFGWLGGLVYDTVGWDGAVVFALGLCAGAALAGLRLRRLPRVEAGPRRSGPPEGPATGRGTGE
ncbi:MULTISPECIES: MFS transporter [Nocardiopsis]|uniref:MFS transporter n=1 Tax=Nocardiopsis sinuspersici TaxID=501010 RepID=A0A1V3BZI2_9ACTN|nr:MULTISPECIES: MFS transporter [Nocardiopsis]OOC53803.1 MFS transporter [Nocardiopsis sinuspersici]